MDGSAPLAKQSAVPRLSRLPRPAGTASTIDLNRIYKDPYEIRKARESVKPDQKHIPHFPPKVATPSGTQRHPRLSLSERTVETLSQVPPSPSPGRRKSSFYAVDSPVKPPPRPPSSLNQSRPISLTGDYAQSSLRTETLASPSKGNSTPRAEKSSRFSTLNKRAVSSYHLKTSSNLIDTRKPTTVSARTSTMRENAFFGSPVKETRHPNDKPQSSSKNLAATPPTARPSVSNVWPNIATSQDSALDTRKPPTTSDALRKTIAAAKAARRVAAQKSGGSSTDTVRRKLAQNSKSEIDFDTIDIDRGGESSLEGLSRRVDAARLDGRLNIAAMGLTTIPKEVVKMYDFENLNTNAGAWYESVDLKRFIAADNELVEIGDDVFPDFSPNMIDDLEERQGEFGAVETLDLHNNHLKTVPIGLRRLERMTMLNVSKNRLSIEAFDIITQIPCLRELRLADNALEGPLPDIGPLVNLTVLDLQNNTLTSLPASMRELRNLRTLNVAWNKIDTVDFSDLAALPLVEIFASRNLLAGTLLPSDFPGIPTLQTLNVSNNSLSFLTEADCVSLPSIQTLNISKNRISSLPDVSNWIYLLNLTAEDNKLHSLPKGFTELKGLKNIDLTGNNITELDPQLATMTSLSNLQIANNPLRERRLLGLSTENLKTELRIRLESEDQKHTAEEDDWQAIESSELPKPTGERHSAWPVKAGGA